MAASTAQTGIAPSLALLVTALTACGGAGVDGHPGGGAGDDWYYHFACNGDAQCLATNPLGTPSGTTNVGPVASSCTSLQLFRTINWGPSSWDLCDHSPTFTPPGTGAPTITDVAPSAGIPGTQITIT